MTQDILNKLNYIYSRLVLNNEKKLPVTEYDLELLENIIKDILLANRQQKETCDNNEYQKKELIAKYFSLKREEELLKQQYKELYNQDFFDYLENSCHE